MSAGSAGAESGGAGSAPRFDDALTALTSVLADLDSVDLHQIPSTSLGAALVALESARNQIDAQVLRVVERFDTAGAHELDGAASSRSWVRANLRRTPTDASRLVGTARKARDLPELTAAFRAGAISQAHLRAVTSAMDRTPARAGTIAQAEPAFASAARELDPQQLARVVRRWAHTVDPLGGLDAERAVHAQRYLSVSSTFDGAVKVDGLLAPEPGAVLLAALEAMTTRDYRDRKRDVGSGYDHDDPGEHNGETTRTSEHACRTAERDGACGGACDGACRGACDGARVHRDGTAGDDTGRHDTGRDDTGRDDTGGGGVAGRRRSPDTDERTGGQRRADAMVELARRFLASGHAGEIGGVRPQLLVTVTAAGLAADTNGEQAPNDEQAPHHENAPDANSTAENTTAEHAPAELAAVGPLSLEAARRIGCDATLTGVTLSATGMPLDYGRSRRVVPAWLRKILVLRDRGCRFPGCDRPPAWCEAHHLVHWSRGGSTDAANLAMLCQHHHHAVHEGGFTSRGSPQEGTLTFLRPDGTRIHDNGRAP